MYNEEGETTWQRSLDSNGNVKTGNNSSCPFLFQGQYYDAEIELAYNRFRYYNPDDGRYISQDPIGLHSGENNFYSYVDDPNGWIDPYGLSGYATKKKEVIANFIKGNKWEKKGVKKLKGSGANLVNGGQKRLVPNNGKGNVKSNRTNTDALEYNGDGTFTIHEFKLSENSGMSTGQRRSQKNVGDDGGLFESRSEFFYVNENGSTQIVNSGDNINVSNYEIHYKN